MKGIYIFSICLLFLCSSLFPVFSMGKVDDSTPEVLPNVLETPAVFGDSFRVLREDSGKIEVIDSYYYLCGVVAAEMPASYETEALKAQAVAAYTFACYRRETRQNKEYDVTDTTSDQAYISPDEQKEKWGDDYEEYSQKIAAAVESVKGQLLTFEGKTILAAYHSISGGKTEAASNVWGDGYPYLQSVESVGDVLSPNYLNVYEFSEDEIKSALSDKGVEFSGSAKDWFKDKKTSDSGTVLSITVCNKEFTGKEMRTALGLKSANFDVSFADGKFTFTVRGYGHGMGMSQYGANFMALQGSSYKDILNWYYPNATLQSI